MKLETPSLRDIRTFGTLAYVDAVERARILDLPAVQRDRIEDGIKRELKKQKIKVTRGGL